MDLSKASDAIHRPLMRTTLYQKGIPIETIKQIWRGRQKTQLMAKTNNQYEEKILNNAGVFQRSAISALLFTIYIDGVAEDYNALNTNKNVERKKTYGRCEQEQQIQIDERIKTIYTYPTKAQQ